MDEFRRLEQNALRYTEAFLRGYRRMLEARVEQAGMTMAEVRDHLPMYAGRLGTDFSVSVLCEPFATWIIFGRNLPGQHIVATADPLFSADWNTYTPYPQKLRDVLRKLAIDPTEVLEPVTISSPGFLCADREHYIEPNAESHGRGRAELQARDVRETIARHENRRRWEGYVGKVREALGAPGTPESGYKLQDGIVGVLEMAGCQPREVSIRGQQIDASCWILSTPVLFEITDSAGPAGAPEVADINLKLQSRPPGVVGIICSPSGFTGGAIENAQRMAADRPILLWGLEEIDRMLSSPDATKDLFVEKYREFIDRAGPRRPPLDPPASHSKQRRGRGSSRPRRNR